MLCRSHIDRPALIASLLVALLTATTTAQDVEATHPIDALTDSSSLIAEGTVVERRDYLIPDDVPRKGRWARQVLRYVRLRTDHGVFGNVDGAWILLGEQMDSLAPGDRLLAFLGREPSVPKPLLAHAPAPLVREFVHNGCMTRIGDRLQGDAALFDGLAPEADPATALLQRVRARLDLTCPRVEAIWFTSGPAGLSTTTISRDDRVLLGTIRREDLDPTPGFLTRFLEDAERLGFHDLPNSLQLPGAGPGSAIATLVLRHRERGEIRVSCSGCPRDASMVPLDGLDDGPRKFVELWRHVPSDRQDD